MGNSYSVRGVGNIEKTGARSWRIRVSLGKDPVTGKYMRSPSRTVTGTKSEATEALIAYHEEIKGGLKPKAEKTTVGEYAVSFHEARYIELTNGLSYQREGSIIDQIVEVFGGYVFRELDAFTVRAVYATLRKNDVLSAHGLHKLHQTFSLMCDRAEEDGIISKSPLSRISVPRPKPEKERNSLSAEEAQRLNGILLGSEPCAVFCAVLLGLHTGMRRGEVLGLMWKHVNFETGRVYIAQQYTHDRKLRSPKSDKSKRWITLDATMLAYLKAWKMFQARELAALDSPVRQTDSTPVVTNEVGGLYDPDGFSRWFRKFCVDNGFGAYGEVAVSKDNRGWRKMSRRRYEGLKFHELRHTQATLLIGSGEDIKTVQARLGHASATLTMDIYAHAIAQNDTSAAATIGDILDGRGGGEEAPLFVVEGPIKGGRRECGTWVFEAEAAGAGALRKGRDDVALDVAALIRRDPEALAVTAAMGTTPEALLLSMFAEGAQVVVPGPIDYPRAA